MNLPTISSSLFSDDLAFKVGQRLSEPELADKNLSLDPTKIEKSTFRR